MCPCSFQASRCTEALEPGDLLFPYLFAVRNNSADGGFVQRPLWVCQGTYHARSWHQLSERGMMGKHWQQSTASYKTITLFYSASLPGRIPTSWLANKTKFILFADVTLSIGWTCIECVKENKFEPSGSMIIHFQILHQRFDWCWSWGSYT